MKTVGGSRSSPAQGGPASLKVRSSMTSNASAGPSSPKRIITLRMSPAAEKTASVSEISVGPAPRETLEVAIRPVPGVGSL